MKYLFLINALFEGVFGALAIAAPQVVWAGGDGLALANGRAFGFAALTISLLSVLVVRQLANRELVFTALATLVLWHGGVTIAEVLDTVGGYTPPPPAVIHGLFTVAFVVFFLRKPAAT